jgi:NAD(P)-dependent dehydrogenase (short-subunit alcohol dehydrogenase family)
MGIAGRDCYTAAKGRIAAITRSLAVAYAPQRVRSNAIAPSATMTERVKKLVAGSAALTRLADSHLLGLIAIQRHDQGEFSTSHCVNLLIR